MEITLTPELEEIVRDKMANGEYPSAEKVIEEALPLLRQHEAQKQKLSELRATIAVGVEQADRGELVRLDAESIKARGRELLAAQD